MIYVKLKHLLSSKIVSRSIICEGIPETTKNLNIITCKTIMNPQICVNCHNKKPVNSTTNRLVTENCGHVKCMDCLIHEKSGCLACIKNIEEKDSDEVSQGEEKSADVTETVKEYEVPNDFEPSDIDGQNGFDSSKKKKPETSHIIEEMVGDMKQYTCTLCKKTFHARSQVIYHAYCNGQRKPYQCPECEKSFAAHSHFKYHMRVHRNERTYACDVCGDSFFQMSKLQRHKLKHTKEKKYACSQCNKAFNNVTSLRKHSLTHTEERPHACAVCGRRFRDSSNYKKHVLKHGYNPEKPCSCGGSGSCAECEGRARRAQGRAHQCPRCPQAFHSRKDMRRHAAVHSDSKPFRCKVCNRRFRRKDNLERHIRNTHPEYVPAMAVECDESALKEIASGQETALSDEMYEKNEKTKLEILNPLPPIPQEVMQKHIDESSRVPKIKQAQSEIDPVDKMSIIEANNARQSVIVEKRNADSDMKSSPENEYVHKIRKATIPLPPIDQEKFRSVQRGYIPDNNDTAPPFKNMEIYKKILYEKLEKDTNEVIQNPKMHWRKKMEQDIN